MIFPARIHGTRLHQVAGFEASVLEGRREVRVEIQRLLLQQETPNVKTTTDREWNDLGSISIHLLLAPVKGNLEMREGRLC